MGQVATLTGMVSQYWPAARDREGDTLAALQWMREQDFFRAFQTVEVPYRQERRAIAQLLHSPNLYLDYCIARVLNEENANLSSLDEAQRARSVRLVKEQLADAHQAEAAAVLMVPGRRPERGADRAAALNALQRSMVELVAYAADRFPNISLVLEPLDVHAHKQHTLGYAAEVVALCDALRAEGLSLRINVDTAHCWLNKEDPLEMLQAVRPSVQEFHFCNCVTDPTDVRYGDRHLAFGEPGRMTQRTMADILRTLLSTGFLNPSQKPYLLLEVIKPPYVDSETHVRNCQQFFTDALALV